MRPRPRLLSQGQGHENFSRPRPLTFFLKAKAKNIKKFSRPTSRPNETVTIMS